jgi:cytochrome c-type biogenesis protein CcmE
MVSCGGGGGGGLVAGGGIGGTGIISTGTITAFGSVEVNGTEFDTSNAAIIINGVEIGVGDDFVPDNLELGMVVTVVGKMKQDGSFVADRVIYSPNIVGPVENISDINATTKEIFVLGQTVIVNVITKFEQTDFSSITKDDVVSVSGYFDDNGIIRATFIEKIDDGTPIFEVTGFVENLDADLKTFMINDLRIDYSSISNNLPEGIPAEDQFVEVEGRLVAGGELIATAIELSDELGGEDGDEFEIMGFVTEVIAVNDIIKFKIGNQEVHVDSDPEIVEYVDGNPSDIEPGQKLEAEGSLEDGILIAVEIEFWEPDQIEVEGIVDDVVFIAGFPEFTYEDRENQVVQTNAETEFENINKEDLEAGLNIEVKGVPQDIAQSVIKADKVSLEID